MSENMEGSIRERSKEFNINQSLIDLQQLTADIHSWCVTNNDIQGEELYLLMMRLKGAVGRAEAKPISKSDIGLHMQKAKTIIDEIKSQTSIPEGTPVYETVTQLDSDIKSVSEIFEIDVDLSKRPLKNKIGISRRQFMKWGALTAIIAGIRAIDSQRIHNVSEDIDDMSDELKQDLKLLRDRYGLEVVTGMPLLYSTLITYEQPSKEEVEKSVHALRRALGVYPPDFLNNIGLTQISLVKHLKPPFSNDDGITDGKTTFENVAVDTDCLDSSSENFELNARHEIYHYGDTGSSIPNSLIKTIEHGFQKRIIKEIEKRATIASTILTPAGYAEVFSGSVIVYNIKRLDVSPLELEEIKRDYFNWSNGKMNDQYWQDIRDGKVHEGYFP